MKGLGPQSLPALRNKIVKTFTISMRSQMLKTLIESLPTGDRFELTIRRRKALAFADSGTCDHEGDKTIFG
jgi:hypothetical protein